MTDAELTWSPRPEVVGLGWVLAVVCGLVAAFLDDNRGTLLLAIAAAVLAVLALFGTVARPRLAAGPHGVAVRSLLGRKQWTWGEVNVRLARTRRLGREVHAVELDADNAEVPSLVVLGRLDLGAEPQDVVEALVRLRT
ncbi:PH domain-containing protein [Actinokineospora pegani]|uniref:PH domain-containing protein n=1 Tax=Actinokineospora pegani TaxID=2654637 RepID=UPI0012EA9D65|nr:PH domain-containing protein [Actinokineospora pegani]